MENITNNKVSNMFKIGEEMEITTKTRMATGSNGGLSNTVIKPVVVVNVENNVATMSDGSKWNCITGDEVG